MSLLCVPCDVPVQPPQSFEDCIIELRKFGASKFALLACNYEFTDITSPAEWEAAIAAGNIAISPSGVLTIGEPEVTNFVITGCGIEAVGELNYPITFTSYSTKLDLSDYDYMIDLFDRSLSLRLIPIDCNSIFNLTPVWSSAVKNQDSESVTASADQSPGFEFSITSPPSWIEGEGSKGQWSMSFSVKTNKPLNGVYLPGVVNVL